MLGLDNDFYAAACLIFDLDGERLKLAFELGKQRRRTADLHQRGMTGGHQLGNFRREVFDDLSRQRLGQIRLKQAGCDGGDAALDFSKTLSDYVGELGVFIHLEIEPFDDRPLLQLRTLQRALRGRLIARRVQTLLDPAVISLSELGVDVGRRWRRRRLARSEDAQTTPP